MGRQPLAAGEKRTRAFTVRFTEAEGDRVEEFGAQLGLDPSVWLRQAGLRAMAHAPRCACGRVATLQAGGVPVCETHFPLPVAHCACGRVATFKVGGVPVCDNADDPEHPTPKSA